MSTGPPSAPAVDVRAWALLVFVLTGLLFARSTGNGFVLYDDDVYVLENPWVRDGLGAEGLRLAFTASRQGNWHPLTWVSHALDVELFGLEPFGHHLVSVLLHSANAALLFLFLAQASGRPRAALLAAALFAWHPLRVESVAWVAERKDVLSGFFALCTLHAYRAWTLGPTAGRYALVALALLAGLAAKPMLVGLPLALLFLDRWPLGRLGPGTLAARLREKLPLLALAAAVVLVTLLTQSAEGATSSWERLPPTVRLANALASVGTYVRQCLWPAHLAVFYPHAASLDPDPLPRLLVPAAVGAGLLALGFAAARRWRTAAPWLGVGLGWAVLVVVPVLGLVQVGAQAHADRYTYLPSIGVAIAAGFGAAALVRRRSPLAWAAGLVLVALGLATWRQQGVWRDTVTLFGHALAVTPPNPVAQRTLARGLRAAGEPGRALPLLEAVHERLPGDVDTLRALGEVRFELGDYPGAATAFREAERLAPGDPGHALNLGCALLELGRVEGALDALERARAGGARGFLLEERRGVALWRTGREDEALAAFAAARAAAGDAGEEASAWERLGALQLAAGRGREAVASFRASVERVPDDPVAWFNLANALERGGARAEAAEAYRRALALDPGLAPARERLDALGEEAP